MNRLNQIENILFILGALMMVVGSAANVLFQSWAPYVFAVGALAFSLMQMKQRYERTNLTIRRLRRIMICSAVLFVLSAFFMFADHVKVLSVQYLLYVQYIHNNWVILLLIAAVLQLYSTHRLGTELEKEAKKR